MDRCLRAYRITVGVESMLTTFVPLSIMSLLLIPGWLRENWREVVMSNDCFCSTLLAF